jgi:hypothetical protein
MNHAHQRAASPLFQQPARDDCLDMKLANQAGLAGPGDTGNASQHTERDADVEPIPTDRHVNRIRDDVHSRLRSRVVGAGLVSLGSSWVNHEIAFGAQGVIRKRLINEQTGSERRRNESANGI